MAKPWLSQQAEGQIMSKIQIFKVFPINNGIDLVKVGGVNYTPADILESVYLKSLYVKDFKNLKLDDSNLNVCLSTHWYDKILVFAVCC